MFALWQDNSAALLIIRPKAAGRMKPNLRIKKLPRRISVRERRPVLRPGFSTSSRPTPCSTTLKLESWTERGQSIQLSNRSR